MKQRLSVAQLESQIIEDVGVKLAGILKDKYEIDILGPLPG